ncbi:hypothetical protein VTH82DRAFT_656 [Thermothelomyces myriococcoides]
MGAQWSQFFPPKPAFTDADVPSQEGKVFLITGGASGIGYELARILYRKGGRVYIAGRDETKCRTAITEIASAEAPAVAATGSGSLEFLHLDLADLRTLKAAAEAFRAKETKLHVLFNNAGVSQPPVGSVSKQGVELQLATNCLGPFLLTKLLLPLLEATAAQEETQNHHHTGTVRVVWLSSQMMELSAPRHGFTLDEIRNPPQDKARNYTNSKTGNFFLSTELARRYGSGSGSGSAGIVSVALNPGAVLTNLFRHTPWLPYLVRPLLYKPSLGALTELYAGLSADIMPERNGCYVLPWGRISTNLREDLIEATKVEEEGGVGRAREFWDYCEEVTREYL